MARSRVRLISAGVAEMLQSDEIRAYLTGPADRVLAAAVASAPVNTGAYRASIHRESATSGSRAVERVVADAPHALVVEARTGNLARALGAA